MADPDKDSALRALERQAAHQRDVDHRVKNTLQLISSVVLLQGRRAADEPVRQALKSVLQRVAAISVAHRHVDWQGETEQVEVAALVREIVGDLAGSAGRGDVAIELELETISIAGRHAAPMALLVGETVGNALRHAFPDGRAGRIQICLRRTADGLEVSVGDDGVGYPAGAPTAGFGLTVVQLMAKQLRGRLKTEMTEPGLRVSLSMPIDRNAAPPN